MNILQQDATLPVADIARKVGLSTTPCWRRIQKLEEDKKDLQDRFTQEGLSGEAINQLSIDLGELENKLEQKTERWFELSSIAEG